MPVSIADFQNLFVKANLTESETNFFLEDAQNVICKLDIESPEQYYQLKETQYCIVEYAFPELKGIAKSGLEKILKAIVTPSETIFNAGSLYTILSRAGNNLLLRRESDGIYVNCGESIERHDCHIILTTEKYNGINRPASHTATLMIDGDDFASVHIEQDESDKGGDIAYLQLHYIPEENQTEAIANIIASFAKWARFNWNNPDKQSEFPTLVRLLGMTTDMRTTNTWNYEKWVALNDATKITKEHLAYEFTSKTIE